MHINIKRILFSRDSVHSGISFNFIACLTFHSWGMMDLIMCVCLLFKYPWLNSACYALPSAQLARLDIQTRPMCFCPLF